MEAKRKTGKAPSRKTPSKRTRAAPAKARGRSETLKMSEASPGFTVNDLEKSLAWYRDVLGFVVEERWEQDGKLMGVSLQAGAVTFMIGQDDWKKGRDRKKGEGFRLFCMTKGNIDDLAKRIEVKGGRLDQGPTDQPWGVRDISLTDPDGFKITIATAKR